MQKCIHSIVGCTVRYRFESCTTSFNRVNELKTHSKFDVGRDHNSRFTLAKIHNSRKPCNLEKCGKRSSATRKMHFILFLLSTPTVCLTCSDHCIGKIHHAIYPAQTQHPINIKLSTHFVHIQVR